MPAQPLERLKAVLANPPFNIWLQPEAVSATVEKVTIRLPVRDDMAGGSDPAFVHGGIVAALIDVAGYAAAACATGRKTPTIGLHIDFLRLATGPSLDATATVRQISKRIARVDVEVSVSGKAVALGRGTFAILEESR